MIPSAGIFPLVTQEMIIVVRSLRLRFAQRRDDMLLGSGAVVQATAI